MQPIEIIVIILAVAIVSGVVISSIKKWRDAKKKGVPPACCDCSSCPHCADCLKKPAEHTKENATDDN